MARRAGAAAATRRSALGRFTRRNVARTLERWQQTQGRCETRVAQGRDLRLGRHLGAVERVPGKP
jgi:hypothetical protein